MQQPHPRKTVLGEETIGITTEGKLKFALEVALLAALLTFPVGSDTAFTAEAWRAASVHF